MNNSFEEGLQLARSLANETRPDDVLTILGAPFIHLKSLVDLLLHVPNIQVAAQNLHHEEGGAYTGEVSASMLASISVPYVIIGHSERREYHQESEALLKDKLSMALECDLVPIFCCGEPLEIRKHGTYVSHVISQLDKSLTGFAAGDLESLIIAYEPIWAIGTGETASPAQAQEMHHAIREFMAEKFDPSLAVNLPILYGGSVKPANAQEIFSQEDVDGGLVGGASLDPIGFTEVINAFE